MLGSGQLRRYRTGLGPFALRLSYLFCLSETAALSLLLGACLGPNPDFRDPQATSAANITDPTSPHVQSTSQAQTSSQTPSEPSQSASSTDTSPTLGILSSKPSTTGPLASTSFSQSTSQSPSTGETRETASSSGSSSTSDSSSEGILPANHRPIVIDTRQTTQALPTPYALSITFDHAALVRQGATVSGSDLVVFRRKGGEVTSLPRVVDPDSAWNRSNTRIWFAPPVEIPNGAHLEQEYYLAWGKHKLAPIEDHSRVFLVYDDFVGPHIDQNRWTTSTSGGGGSTPWIQGGQLHLRTNSFLSSQSHSGIELKDSRNFANFIFESRSRSNTGFISLGCSWSELMSLRADSPHDHLVKLEGQLHHFRLRVINPRDVRLNLNQQLSAPLPPQGQWHRLAMAWNGANFKIASNGTTMFQDGDFSRVVAPAQSKVRLGFSTRTNGLLCALQTARAELSVEWALLRHYVPGVRVTLP